MLSKLFESLYNKVIISIIVKRSSTDVYIELCSKKGEISHSQESFESVTLNEKMISFISSYIKESPFHYIALLDNSTDQGALPSCDKHELEKLYDLSICETKCYNKSWTYFTSKSDLTDQEKSYKPFDVDFIFSPFIILNNFFQDKIGTTLAMFVLIQEHSLSLMIFDHGELLYGEHLDMETHAYIDDSMLSQTMETSSEIEDSDDDMGSIDLEDIDVIDDIDDLDGLDDFGDLGDIEDLDTLEEIDEFSQKDVEEEFYEAEDESILEEGGIDTFNEDYQRFSLIQNSLGEFYKSSKYKSQFIENIYLADGTGVSGDLKRYLEEEMFLNVYIRHLALGIESVGLVKEELGI